MSALTLVAGIVGLLLIAIGALTLVVVRRREPDPEQLDAERVAYQHGQIPTPFEQLDETLTELGAAIVDFLEPITRELERAAETISAVLANAVDAVLKLGRRK